MAWPRRVRIPESPLGLGLPAHRVTLTPRPTPLAKALGGRDSLSEENFGGSRRPIVEGVRWSTAGRISLQTVRIGVTFGLARLLGAEDFGLMGAALVVVHFLDALHFSTGAVLVQRPRVDRAFASSIFVLNVALGLCIATTLWLAAPALARAYGQGELLADLFRALAIAVALTGCSTTHRSLLRRRMDFASLALVDLVGALTNGAIAIGMALRGYGVWSMVIGYICSILLQNLVVLVRAAWLPSLRVRGHHLREVAGFTTNLTASHILLFVFTNLDSFLITRYLGVSAMGYYALAQRVMNPSRIIVNSLISVMNPALAHIQTDLPRFRRELGRAVAGVAFVIAPILVGIAITMRPFTSVVLGEEWLPSVPIAQILALTTLLVSWMGLGDALFVATARTGLLLRWTFARGSVLALGYWVGLHWGLVGLAWGGAAATALVFLPAVWHPLHVIGFPLRDLGREIAPYLGLNLILVATALATLTLCTRWGAAEPVQLVTTAAIGATAYALATLWIDPPLLGDLRRVVGLGTPPRTG